MSCRTVIDAPGLTVISCTRGTSRPRCATTGCTGTAVARCAFPLTGRKAGSACGRAVCTGCRRSQPSGVDYCPTHAAVAAITTKAAR